MIIEPGFSPDQRRQINHLAADKVLARDRPSRGKPRSGAGTSIRSALLEAICFAAITVTPCRDPSQADTTGDVSAGIPLRPLHPALRAIRKSETRSARCARTVAGFNRSRTGLFG